MKPRDRKTQTYYEIVRFWHKQQMHTHQDSNKFRTWWCIEAGDGGVLRQKNNGHKIIQKLVTSTLTKISSYIKDRVSRAWTE